MRDQGQNLIEFLLILSLVVIGGILAFTLLGGNVDTLFSKINNVDPFNTNSQTNQQEETNNSIPPPNPVVSTETIAGYPVDIHEDGSASFKVGTQPVSIPKSALDLQNTVFQTTGSSGMTDLVKEVAYMIQSNSSTYPEGNVPVTISYGTGYRSWVEGSSTYTGVAEVNTTFIKVGSDMVIIQQDQKCTGTCSYTGRYRIEGHIAIDNTFDGTVTSNVNTYGSTHGTFTATIDQSSGLKVSNSKYNHYDNYYTTTPASYNWNIDFSKPEYFYGL